MSVSLLYSCSPQITKPEAETTSSPDTQTPSLTEQDAKALKEIQDNIIRIEPYDPDKLTTLNPLPRYVAGTSSSLPFDIEIRAKSENAFSDPGMAIGYKDSTLPVALRIENRTGSPATILMGTLYHRECTVKETEAGTATEFSGRENWLLTNLYLPVRSHDETVPIVRPRSVGKKYYSVFFFARLPSGEIVEMLEAKPSKCNPIEIHDQPGKEF